MRYADESFLNYQTLTFHKVKKDYKVLDEEVRKKDARDKAKEIVGGIAANLVLAVLSFLVLFPLLFMICSSFRSTEEYFARIA